jgi:hypothetical protein
MIGKLEEILPVEVSEDLSPGEVFEKLTAYTPKVINGGIAMSSGCVSCNNGGGGGKPAIYESDGKDETYKE